MKTVTLPIKEYKDLLVKAKAYTGPLFQLRLRGEKGGEFAVEAYDSHRTVNIGTLKFTRPNEATLLEDYKIFMIKDRL